MRARSLFAGLCVLVGLGAAVASAAPGAPVQGAPAPAPAESFQTVDRTNKVASPDEFARMRAIAARDGRVRLIAGLRTSFTPQGALSSAARQSQRGAIDDATASVLGTLRGTPHNVVHTYETVPYIALELSTRALGRLEATKAVATLQGTGPSRRRSLRAHRSWRPPRTPPSAARAPAARSPSWTPGVQQVASVPPAQPRRVEGGLRGVLLRERRTARAAPRRARRWARA